MAPIWSLAEGPHILLFDMLETCFLYAISLGLLVILGRIIVLIARKYFSLNKEAYIRAWILCSAWLGTGQLYAVWQFYDTDTPLILVLSYSVLATIGISLGMGLVGMIVAGAVFVCKKYL